MDTWYTNLTIAMGYVKKLIRNARIEKFITKHYPELMMEFRDLVEMKSLNG